MHGDTNFYWRVIIGEDEYLPTTLNCLVNTFSDESFDQKANATKWHLAGRCQHFRIDEEGNATFSN